MNLNFVLVENDQTLNVVYNGTEPPPDTFKDNAQALAEGSFNRDGVFYAKQIQAKCASKYAPQDASRPSSEDLAPILNHSGFLRPACFISDCMPDRTEGRIAPVETCRSGRLSF